MKFKLNRDRLSYVVVSLSLAFSLSAGCRNKEPRVKAPAPFASAQVQPAPASLPVGASQTSYADIVERVRTGVVTIRTERRVRPPQQYPFFDNPLFPQFFGESAAPGRKLMGLGSGVIVEPEGTILTNFHVVDGAEQIQVELINHRIFDAKVIGRDPPSDLAVLKIDAKDLDALTLGDSDRVRVGDIALAIGNPLGIGQTVTSGIISAKERATGLSDGSFEDFLQTDAAINQGNSGGALINTQGELIGINSQILSTSGGNIGIGFAIPSKMARNVLGQVLKTGKVRRGLLGVGIQPMTAVLADNSESDVDGLVVYSVMRNGPAAKAGIRKGDTIVKFNGSAVSDPNILRNQVAGTMPGTDVNLTILRDHQEQEVKVTLGEYQAKTRRSMKAVQESVPQRPLS